MSTSNHRRARRRPSAVAVAVAALSVLVALGIVVALTNGFSPNKGTGASAKAGTTTTTAITAGSDSQVQSRSDLLAAHDGCPNAPKTKVKATAWTSPPAFTVTPGKMYTAVFVTTAGTFNATLDVKQAPQTVGNFIFLATHQYFSCNSFDLVVPGAFDATGDPSGTGTGSPGYTLAPENVPTSYVTGDLAMRKTGSAASGGQFLFVVDGKQSSVTSDASSVFGTVTTNMSVLRSINHFGNTSKGGHTPQVVFRLLYVQVHESA